MARRMWLCSPSRLGGDPGALAGGRNISRPKSESYPERLPCEVFYSGVLREIEWG